MKTRNRLLAAMLALVMIISMLPISAFAENDAPATGTDIVVEELTNSTINADMTLYADWEGNTPAPTRSGMLRNVQGINFVMQDSYTFPAVQVGYTSVDKKGIALENKGSETITVTISGNSNSDCFNAYFSQNASSITIDAGSNDFVYVERQLGLSQNDYSGTITVTATTSSGQTDTKTLTLSQKVNPAALQKYLVIFYDEDGTTVLQIGEWEEGSTPAYSGQTPTKAADAQHTYTFAGWNPAITPVTGDATYKATYRATPISATTYTVRFVDEDGTTVLQAGEWEEGSTPVYSGQTPTKAADAQYTYTFAGWNPAITPVTDDATYKATYTATPVQGINFVMQDSYTFPAVQVGYTSAGKKGIGLQNKGSETITVTISGNSNPDCFNAYFSGGASSITIDANKDDFVYVERKLGLSQNDYSGTITVTATTSSGQTDTKTLTLSQKVNPAASQKYLVIFYDEDGTTVLQIGEWEEGSTPAYSGQTPTKAADAQYTYTFAGWNPAITPVTGDATYKATYRATPVQGINFVMQDSYTFPAVQVGYTSVDKKGIALQNKGSETITVTISGNSNPDCFNAYFSGGASSITIDANKDDFVYVERKLGLSQNDYSGTITVTATTSSGQTDTKTLTLSQKVNPAALQKYTVSFYDEDGTTVLQTGDWEEGSIPVYSGQTPTKAADAQYTYTFAGWDPAITKVTGNATYKATYTATPIPAQTGQVEADPVSLSFGSVQQGYASITPKPVTIRNNTAASVTISALGGLSAFEATAMDASAQPVTLPYTLPAGESINLAVHPKSDLAANDYSETLTVAYNDGADKTLSVALSFTVTGTPPQPTTKHTVTYIVVNGTWADGTKTNKTEEVEDGKSPANIPSGMLPDTNYEGGAWSPNPSGAAITDNTTFTYTFTAKQPQPTTISYAAKDGSGNTIQSVTWQKGSGKNLDLTFKRSEDDHLTYGLFDSLEIGGVTVGSANYGAAEGSLKLSIKPEYLETLSVGDHTVKVNFQDGSATVKLTVKTSGDPNIPRTADESHLALWSSLMFLSLAGLLAVAVNKRRRKTR